MISTREQVPALTGLRFIAALLVIIAHSGISDPTYRGSSLIAEILRSLSPTGMMLFFTLSGFVMWLNYAQPIACRRPRALRDFAVARFARLYPMYFIVTALAIVMTLLVHGEAALEQTFPGFLLYIPLLQSWFPGNSGRLVIFSVPFIGHLWSISTEIFLYAMFPLIAASLFWIRSIRATIVIGIANCMLAAAAFYFVYRHHVAIMRELGPTLPEGEAVMWLAYYSPYMRMFQFVAGCVACHVFLIMKDREITRSESRTMGLTATAAIITICAIPLLFSAIPRWPAYYMATSVVLQVAPLAAMSFLMFFVSRYRGVVRRVLSLQLMVFGGEVSYSLYLLHPIVLEGIQHARGGLPAGWTGDSLFVLAFVAVVIAVSSVTFFTIERPARKWLRARLAGSARIAFPAAPDPAFLPRLHSSVGRS